MVTMVVKMKNKSRTHTPPPPPINTTTSTSSYPDRPAPSASSTSTSSSSSSSSSETSSTDDTEDEQERPQYDSEEENDLRRQETINYSSDNDLQHQERIDNQSIRHQERIDNQNLRHLERINNQRNVKMEIDEEHFVDSSPQHLIEIDLQPVVSIIKRKALINELSASYQAECISRCQELLRLQSRWRQEIDDSNTHHGAESHAMSNQMGNFEDAHTVELKSYQTSSTQSASNDDATSGDMLDNSTSASQDPLRRHLLWRSNERDALRRGLLMFGLGRSDKVRSVMSSLLKKMRHGIGDIADCCWEFVRFCADYSEDEGRKLAKELHEKFGDLDIEAGEEVQKRVGSWDKSGKSATVWLKRLVLLDNLGNAIRLCASTETQEAAYGAIDNLKDVTSPLDWWGREADLALLAGVYKHGFGSYDAIRSDPQFADAFRPPTQNDNSKTWQNYPEEDPENLHRDDSNSAWPDANILTRRLKRLVAHICRIEKEFDVSGKQIKEKPSRVWTKKEKNELYNVLLAWGHPLETGDDLNAHWENVKTHAKISLLKSRNASSIESGIKSLEAEMLQIINDDGSNGAKSYAFEPPTSTAVGPKFLSLKTAKRLSERLELLDILRQAVTLMPDDWGQLSSLLSQKNDMPSWWRTCHDDRDLVKGVLRYGCGNWEAIFDDNNLFVAMDSTIDTDSLPDSKTCMKRLRFISSKLKRHLQKLKGRRKRPIAEDKENENGNESKRYKRVKPVEIIRGPDGKPVLPIALAERLTVLSLGTIEHERSSFHTDRHVFPIGYTAIRNYWSMVRKDERTNYRCMVLDDGHTSPIFRVIPEDSPHTIIDKDSASGAWAVVVNNANKIRGIETKKITTSGTEMFGISHPNVLQLLSELPGAEYCSTFGGHPNSGQQSQKKLIKASVPTTIQDGNDKREIELDQTVALVDDQFDSSSTDSSSSDESDSSDSSDDTDEDQNFSSQQPDNQERTFLDINADPEDFGSP